MTYTPACEAQRRRFYASLSEQDRHRYAAIETAKLGHGGPAYAAAVLGGDPQTIRSSSMRSSPGGTTAPGPAAPESGK